MSYEENWSGILEKIEVSKDLTFQEQIEYLKNEGYDIDSYERGKIFIEESDCFCYKDEWYKFVEKEDHEDNDYICEAKKIDDKISFRLRFYNGGTCFDEMLEKALDNLRIKEEKK